MKKKYLNSRDFRKLKVGEVIKKGDVGASKIGFPADYVGLRTACYDMKVEETDGNWYYRPIKHRRKMVVVTV